MRFFNVIKKEILHLLHDPETVTLMILFPFLLTCAWYGAWRNDERRHV